MSTATLDSKAIKFSRANLDQIYYEFTDNVREEYNEVKLEELKDSIRQTNGITTPVQVVESKNQEATDGKPYVLYAGYRRIMCLEALKEEDASFANDIPIAIGDPTTESGVKALQLVENMQRDDLNPMELAGGIKDMMEGDTKLTQKEVGQMLGISQGTVSNYSKLLALPEEVQDWIREDMISLSSCWLLVENVPPNHMAEAAKLALGYTTEKLREKLEKAYSMPTDDEGEKTEKEATQRAAKAVRANDLQDTYLPHFVAESKKAAEAGNKEVAGRWKLRADVLKWVLKNEDTAVGKDLEPWEAELEKKKEKEALDKQMDKLYSKFIRDRVKGINELYNTIPEPGQTRPTLAECFATIRSNLETEYNKLKEAASNDDDLKASLELKYGFELGSEDHSIDKVMEEVTAAWDKRVADSKKRKEALAKAREEKKRKGEEEAKKAKKEGEPVAAK